MLNHVVQYYTGAGGTQGDGQGREPISGVISARVRISAKLLTAKSNGDSRCRGDDAGGELRVKGTAMIGDERQTHQLAAGRARR